MNTLASIIIVTYNGLAYLSDCLSSLGEAFATGCEVIVVDNRSKDGSVAYIQTHYPQVRILENTSNQGFAAACNRGAEIARGEILVFLNQDTRVVPGWLSGLVNGLTQNPSVGLTTSKVLLMSQPDKIQLCGQNLHFTGLAFGRGLFHNADELTASATVTAVSGASFAIRCELWEQLGGFDESFYMYYEETELSWRAQQAGYQCLYVPESVVYHDFRPSRPSFLQLFYSFRNRYKMLLKHWRGSTLLLLLPSLLLAELIDWVIALAYGSMGLKAKLMANQWVADSLCGNGENLRRPRKSGPAPDWAILDARTHQLEPKVVTGGWPGRLVITWANAFFAMNYHTARFFCRVAGI